MKVTPELRRKLLKEIGRATGHNQYLGDQLRNYLVQENWGQHSRKVVKHLMAQLRAVDPPALRGARPLSERSKMKRFSKGLGSPLVHLPPSGFTGNRSRPRDASARPWRPGDQRKQPKKKR